MPTYLYRCKSCESEASFWHHSSVTLYKRCGNCGDTLKKVPSLGGFELNGGGWPGKELKKVE